MAPKAPPEQPKLTTQKSPDAFDGSVDAHGHGRICPDGTIPAMRPTINAVKTIGGVSAFKRALKHRRPPNGGQAPYEHDCWLNDAGAPGNEPDGGIAGTMSAQYEHAVGTQSVTAYGLLTDMSVYGHNNGQVETTGFNQHQDAQIWVQTGTCDNLYPNPHSYGNACTTGAGGNAIQSLEAGWIVAPEQYPFGATQTGTDVQDPFLFFFFTSDAYFDDYCWAGQGGGCCTAGALGDSGLSEGSDCWVAWPGATFTANQKLTASSIGTTPPQELVVQVWQGYPSTTPGWWVWVDGNLTGWYPPNTFTWPAPASGIGPMGYGPGSYIQLGGEVYDAWQTGGHTSSSMGSGIAPAVSGGSYGYSAYHRNMAYINGSSSYVNTALTYSYAPTYEKDYNVGGVCGYHAGWWTNNDGTGAYSLSVAGAPAGSSWGQYFYFGGGEGQCLAGATPPCVAPP